MSTYGEEREQREAEYRERLAAHGYDGPHSYGLAVDLGSAFMEAFGGGLPPSYAYCLTCGSAVPLGHPVEREDGPPIERAVQIHTAWHRETKLNLSQSAEFDPAEVARAVRTARRMGHDV